jgi:signal transduction histidine kinase
MQVLIDDLLTYSRTTNSPRNFSKTDLNLILNEAKKELRDSIEEKKAAMQSDDLPEAHVIPFQFRQLLVNLLMNSIKYSKPDVPPRIRITYGKIPGKNIVSQSANPSLDYHRFCVTDNGIGFEQQYALRIFELFQRLHGRFEYPGTGLGLAICKKIMENHHGFIEATSVLNEGATFIMYFPVQPLKPDQ